MIKYLQRWYNNSTKATDTQEKGLMLRANRPFVKGIGGCFLMNWLWRLLFMDIYIKSRPFFSFLSPGKFYTVNMLYVIVWSYKVRIIVL